ncbi:cation:proton antiporter [Patescibacteria group bacterium]|nr:cation:proton antiporter [Patescibacteria group bacterium]
MSILLTITIALLVTFVGARTATHFKYPPILGQFIASLFLAVPLIKNNIFTPESAAAIETFAELAIIFLLLLTGLVTDIDRINQCKKKSILTAVFGSLIPLFLGTAAGYTMGFPLITSIVLGISLSITAEGANMAILLQLKKVKTKVGSILISAGMLDDIFGMIYLAIILILANRNNITTLFLFPVKLFIFIGIVWAASKIIPSVLSLFEKKRKDIAMFNVVILSALILAIFSELAGLSAIVGAFIAGIILQKSFKLKKDEKYEEHEMETFLFGFIIPFFFINIALNFDFRSLAQEPLLILIVFSIAIAGKMAGALLVKLFDHLSWKQAYLIGWGMNSRGVIELVIANIALKTGLISTALYSAIVMMAILTTIVSLFFIRNIIKNDPKITS